MDSIYGGRPGAPFVIKGVFKSVKDMQDSFRKGLGFKDVWIGDYCIIDTPNKNDWDNGKIYQRGPEWANDDGDAKYIGQIVGPQSGVPQFEFGTLADVSSYTDLENGAHKKPFAPIEAGKPGYETRTWLYDEDKLYQDRADNHKDHTDKSVKVKSYKVSDNSLVPGMSSDANNRNFKDSIRYNWVNIAYPYGTKEDGSEEDADLFSTAKTLVGFEIPYTVHEIRTHPRLPYGASSPYAYDNSAPMKEDASTVGHPFAYLWDLYIPIGIKGDSVRNIRKLTRSGLEEAAKKTVGGTFYFMDEISVSATDDKYNVSATPSQSRTWPKGWGRAEALFWVCDFCHYANYKTGEVYTILLGSAEEFENVEYDYKSGKLKFKFTNSEAISQDLPAVNEFTFNDDEGTWSIGFNNSTIGLTKENFPGNGSEVQNGSRATGKVKLMRNTQYTTDGKFTINYTKGNPETHNLPAVNEFSFDSGSGSWAVGFNNESINLDSTKFPGASSVTKSRATGKIKLMKDTQYTTDGKLTVNYTVGESNVHDLPSINKFSVDRTGKWTVGFNNAAVGLKQADFDGAEVSADGKSVSGQIVFVNQIACTRFDASTNNTDGTTLRVTNSKNETTSTTVVNEVVDFYADLGADRSNHLYVLFSEKKARNNDNAGGKYVKGIQSTRVAGDTTGLCWVDLGSIKDQSGLTAGHDLSKEPDLSGKENASEVVDWLNKNCKLHYDASSLTYSDPSNRGYSDGKLLTYVTEDGNSWFFAWDYSTTPSASGDYGNWYFVGQTSASSGSKAFFADIIDNNGTLTATTPAKVKEGDTVFLRYTLPRSVAAAPKNWWE